MRTLSRNRRPIAVLAWLPVVGVVAALFLAPSSTGAAATSSLTVTPGGGQYGGTPAHWTGNLDFSTGSPQAIHLQRRGSTTSAWADVENSNVGSTDASGHFDFWFPSPAMNSVYFRVKSRRGASPAHHFTSKHQDADLRIYEDLTPEGVLPLTETIAEGLAVRGEGFTLKVDTVHGAKDETKPALAGRAITLQRRTGPGTWEIAARGTLDRNGLIAFDGSSDLGEQSGDYRVKLEKFVPSSSSQCTGQQPCEIGWFLTFPFNLKVVDRPESPVSVSATAAGPSMVNLTWRLVPRGAAVEKVVVARGFGGGAPGYRGAIATLPGTATSYTDSGPQLSGGTTYSYSVFAVTRDGVYSLNTAHATVTTPPDPKTRGEGR